MHWTLQYLQYERHIEAKSKFRILLLEGDYAFVKRQPRSARTSCQHSCNIVLLRPFGV